MTLKYEVTFQKEPHARLTTKTFPEILVVNEFVKMHRELYPNVPVPTVKMVLTGK